MDIMTFMEENYIVLILVGVIILMTIIGYIADKTDFGKKDKKKDKKENKKQNEVVEDINEEQVDNSFVEEVQPETTFEEVQPEPVMTEDLSTSFDMPENVEPIEETSFEPVEEVQSEEVEMPVQEEAVESNEAVEEPVVEEVQPVESVHEEVPTHEEVQPVQEDSAWNTEEVEQQNVDYANDNIDSSDFQLPNIEKLNEELSDVDDDEDVWKF